MIRLDARFFPADLRDAATSSLPDAATALEAVRQGECTGGEFTGWFDWPRRHGFALASEVKQYVQ